MADKLRWFRSFFRHLAIPVLGWACVVLLALAGVVYGGEDSARAITVDRDGNIIVSGIRRMSMFPEHDILIIKYSPTGEVIWAKAKLEVYDDYFFRNKNMALDANGIIITCSRADDRFIVFKYSSATGMRIWLYDLGKGWGCAVAIWSNYFHVTGTGWHAWLGDYYSTCWLNAFGVVQRWDDSRYKDHSRAIAVDGGGNIIVTGYNTKGREAGWLQRKTKTIKYDNSGNLLWSTTYRYGQDYDDVPHAMAVDSGGNIYITGSFEKISENCCKMLTLKYTPAGTLAKTMEYSGPGKCYASGFEVVVDKNDNIVVGGTLWGGGNVIVKYKANGDVLWEKTYGTCPDILRSLAVDASGNIYFTGYSSHGSSERWNYLTYKLNANGDVVRRIEYDGGHNGDDLASAIAVDASGNFYVTGESWNGTDYDYVTIKYKPDGTQDWVRRYDSP